MIHTNLQNVVSQAMAPEVITWDHLGPSVTTSDGLVGFTVLKRVDRQGYQTGYQFSISLGKVFSTLPLLKAWYETTGKALTQGLYPNLGLSSCVPSDGAGKISITSLGAIDFLAPSTSPSQSRQPAPIEFTGGLSFPITVTTRG